MGIWLRGWVFAGHTCEISMPGDYFTLTVDTDLLLVIRDDAGQVRAFHGNKRIWVTGRAPSNKI